MIKMIDEDSSDGSLLCWVAIFGMLAIISAPFWTHYIPQSDAFKGGYTDGYKELNSTKFEASRYVIIHSEQYSGNEKEYASGYSNGYADRMSELAKENSSKIQ